MQSLAFSRSIDLSSLYLVSFIKFVPKTLFLVICVSYVTICLWRLSTKGEFLHFHGRLSGFAKNKSKSRLLTTFLKLKNLKDICAVSLSVIMGIGNLTNNERTDLTVSGSRKIPAIFINYTPLF